MVAPADYPAADAAHILIRISKKKQIWWDVDDILQTKVHVVLLSSKHIQWAWMLLGPCFD